jgi:hypothetical protein
LVKGDTVAEIAFFTLYMSENGLKLMADDEKCDKTGLGICNGMFSVARFRVILKNAVR